MPELFRILYQVKNNIKFWVFADVARGLGAHLYSSPWIRGGKKIIIKSCDISVLRQFTFKRFLKYSGATRCWDSLHIFFFEAESSNI